jgi:hypothetical protein
MSQNEVPNLPVEQIQTIALRQIKSRRDMKREKSKKIFR